MKPSTMALRRTAVSHAALLLPLYFGASCSPSDEHEGHEEPGHQEDSDNEDEHGHQEDSDHEEDESEHGGENGHEGEHVEGRVELTERQFASAEIQVQRVGPGEVGKHLTLPAVVSVNRDTSTHVNPKVPGLVRSIQKHLGEHVEVGDVLCSIDSVELGSSVADLVLARALVGAAEETLAKEELLFDQRMRTADEVFGGAIAVNESIYEREKELQEKAVSTIRPLLEAEKVLKNSKLAREQRLSDLRAERAARLLALDVVLREKRILAEAARNRLLALGIEEELLADVGADSPLLLGAYEIHAARSGVVTARHISAGEYVDTETKLFTVEDLSRVWVIASVFEQEVLLVRTGQEAIVKLNSFPGRAFSAKVAVVEYEANIESRAIGVRLELDNPELIDWPEEYPIRPGMFGSVELVVGLRRADVVVPESAVVHGNDGDSVFVRLGERVFQQRSVTVVPGTGEVVEVLSGLEPGDEVAVTGTFLLRSVAGQEELGGGHSH